MSETDKVKKMLAASILRLHYDLKSEDDRYGFRAQALDDIKNPSKEYLELLESADLMPTYKKVCDEATKTYIST
jgi:hypothetical protein